MNTNHGVWANKHRWCGSFTKLKFPRKQLNYQYCLQREFRNRDSNYQSKVQNYFLRARCGKD